MSEKLLEHVDVSEELASFDWRAPRWQAEKLICASPFRDDMHPSFYVYLTDTPSAKAGSWGDSGTGDRGGFVRLLAELRGESTDEVIAYLREKYGVYADDEQAERFTLPSLGAIRQQAVERARVRTLQPPQGQAPAYVIDRGVAPETAADAGVVQAGNAVAFPWRDRKGRCRAVKYRSITGKAFWYAKGGENIRDLVYGIDAVAGGEVALVESEIDALYLRTAGVRAVATGGAELMNEKKAEIIAASGVEAVVIVADHDAAGQRMKREAIELLRKYPGVAAKVAGYPARYKDANEVGDMAAIRAYVTKSKYVRKMKPISRHG
ncbi:toprim domain-containing protein [Salibacterium lacus]|uniref:Toprim domain-containing protein n=1 Tax=Salibacterium lacus TaxID=1898109 RepID=A0ABW5SZI6_9BACI